jgi:hypothetical protein
MLAPTSFPKWLPPAVADEAQRILDTESADAALVHRLAMDPRMESVWRELSRNKFDRPQLEDSVLNLRPPLGDHLTDQEAALTLFFWWAYVFARLPIALATISELHEFLSSCENTARQLRAAAVALRELPNKLSRSELLQIRDLSPQFGDIYAKQVEEAAQFCDEAVGEIINQKAIDPLVVDRPGYHRTARGYVLNLAGQISKPLYGTLAIIASVALDCTVTKQQVIDWARGIERS